LLRFFKKEIIDEIIILHFIRRANYGRDLYIFQRAGLANGAFSKSVERWNAD